MSEEIVSLAVLEALPDKEEELVSMLRELYAMMNAKGYCRDALYRDSTSPTRFFHVRYWASAAMRTEAQTDPEVHRYWLRLPELCVVTIIVESAETVFES